MDKAVKEWTAEGMDERENEYTGGGMDEHVNEYAWEDRWTCEWM